MEYSKGKWKKRKYKTDSVIYTTDGGAICDVVGTGTDKGKADLTLLVNAKEMFECLKGINDLMHEHESGYASKIATMETAKMLKKIHSDYGKLLK